MPLTDTNPNLVSTSSPNVALHLDLSPPESAQSESQLQLKPRFLDANAQTITFSSSTYLTRITAFTPLLPRQIALPALTAIYLQIQYNLSRHGKWYNAPRMKRIVIQAKEMYIVFTATQVGTTVPWELVRHWVEAISAFMDRPGGFIGFYVASFESLGTEREVSYWVQTGIQAPVALTAAAA
ncbi:MAG: hypothetical protein Q9186_003239 [Xanthomendoza sp. 1 TL-2023]